MKTKSIITGILFFISLGVIQGFAKEVTADKAENAALNLYVERAPGGSSGVKIDRVIEEKENGETVFYIMVYSATGFALISADDAVQPVLGYSFESGFDENNLSPAFEFYILDRLRKQIYEVKKAQPLPDQETIIEWQRLSVSPKGFQPKSVESFIPLLNGRNHQKIRKQDQCYNHYINNFNIIFNFPIQVNL